MPDLTKWLWLDADIKLKTVDLLPGWCLVYHQLYDVHPDKPVSVGNCPNGDYSELFKSTLLVIEHAGTASFIDVGWGPEAELSGAFYITYYRNGNLSEPVQEISTREPDDVITLVEHVMAAHCRDQSAPE
ncbi:hypothetical protein [Marinobacter lipolyticus]|uniref:hypothetical protein n=1 Tax=Marinobacter lipolyticus TaxID=209639 RepID=UPI003A91D657